MSDPRLDLDAIEAGALRDGSIPASQAHALVTEVRLLRQQLAALDRREKAPADGEPEEAGWASVG